MGKDVAWTRGVGLGRRGRWTRAFLPKEESGQERVGSGGIWVVLTLGLGFLVVVVVVVLVVFLLVMDVLQDAI